MHILVEILVPHQDIKTCPLTHTLVFLLIAILQDIHYDSQYLSNIPSQLDRRDTTFPPLIFQGLFAFQTRPV